MLTSAHYSQLSKLFESIRSLVAADPSTLTTLSDTVDQLSATVTAAESTMARLSVSAGGTHRQKVSYQEQLARLSDGQRVHLNRNVGTGSAAAQVAAARSMGWL